MVLDGIKVLDLTRLLPGPFCTMFLADFGAEVIKIEETGRGDYARWSPPLLKGVGVRHLIVNRGKKSLTLNLKTPEGKEILLKLARQADVLVEGFRPGVMDRLELGYENLKKENPRLVYCAITGFGQDGPYRDRPGHDLNYISIAGVLGNNGPSDGPPVVPGVQIADLGGAIVALVGILMALLGRERSGQGELIDISMTDAAFLLGVNAASQYAALKQNPLRGGERLTGGKACYQVYRTKDERYISVGALEDKFWASLCRALGRDDLVPELDAPPARQKELIRILQEIFLTRSLDEWVQILELVDTCFAPVLTLEEAFRNPQLLSREMVCLSQHPVLGMLTQLGLPIKLKEAPGKINVPAPEIGEHNTEILNSLGYTHEEIGNFRAQGIV
jgi:crotonobetainyl-CoA:carnitine CoA-transferase CaiB-like acyl-CoA transferase